MRNEQEVLSNFKNWANQNDLVRAAVLTSSRVIPDSSIDFLSDYDIELYVSELYPFKENDNWLNVFGSVMVRWPFKPRSTLKKDWVTRLVLFKDGVRIDFQITDNLIIQSDAYDNGYKILIDKDNLLSNINEPTFTEYIIKKPSKDEFETLVNEFWWDAVYVPKYLWRDELPFAKYMLDNILRYNFLHRIIEWYIGIQNDWSVSTGNCGKKFKRYLDTNIWQEFESTYTGANIDENWLAFFNTIKLFRKLSTFLAVKLGYCYPNEVDKDVTQYCIKIQQTEK